MAASPRHFSAILHYATSSFHCQTVKRTKQCPTARKPRADFRAQHSVPAAEMLRFDWLLDLCNLYRCALISCSIFATYIANRRRDAPLCKLDIEQEANPMRLRCKQCGRQRSSTATYQHRNRQEVYAFLQYCHCSE